MAEVKNESVENFLASASEEGPSEAEIEAAENPESDLEAPEPQEAETSAEDAAEPAEEPSEAAPAEERPPRNVPIQALDEERGLRRDAEARMAEYQKTIDKQNERFAQVVEMWQNRAAGPQQPEQPQGPTYEDDPAEYLRAQVNELQQTKQAFMEQQQVQGQVSQAQQMLLASQTAYMEQKPDFPQALQAVRNGTAQQISAVEGLGAQAAQQKAEQVLFEQAVRAMASGVDPAQAIYSMASVFGYQAPAAETGDAGVAPSMESQAAKLKTVQQGQAANKSLSDGGDTAAPPPASLEDLANMSDEEFDKSWSKVIGTGDLSFRL